MHFDIKKHSKQRKPEAMVQSSRMYQRINYKEHLFNLYMSTRGFQADLKTRNCSPSTHK